MKKIRINVLTLAGVIVTFTCLLSSCNDDYLDEIPMGFLSPENTFVNKEGFESGIAELYRVSRTVVTSDALAGMIATERDKSLTTLYASGTDMGWYWDKKNYYGDYAIINSFDVSAQNLWIRFYTLIKDANVILSRSESEAAKWDSEEDKLLIQAEARFFRGLAYRYLAHLFGGVPVIDAEITSPVLDFVRASREDVLDFIVRDLEFAIQYLPVTNNRDGHITVAAANQLLAETYIATGEYDKSIEASSRIINDPQYHLMTERFGTMTDKPGDVFWDLFRLGNQNNSQNKEVIWAWQVEYNVPGGDAPYTFERSWGPLLEQLKTPDGKVAILKDEFLGRPIGFIRPSVFLEYTIWKSDWDNDIRNSEYNMKRHFIINNPASSYYGQVYQPTKDDTVRKHFVYVQKAAHPYGHPQGYDTGGQLFSDCYAMRLAETYLLRAEAYLNKNEKVKAAADINVVRARANATPVNPDELDIEYLLDERARELVAEEPRRLTLARLGLLYSRVKNYNPVSASSIKEYNNLLPIPQTEIDANQGAVLEQNPGYN